jgi:hypothetical protein
MVKHNSKNQQFKIKESISFLLWASKQPVSFFYCRDMQDGVPRTSVDGHINQ